MGGFGLAAGTEQPPTGLHYKDGSTELSASNDTVIAIAGTAERVWSETLKWSANNPIEFALVVVLLAFIVIQRRRSRLDLAHMKQDYQMQRENAHNRQPPLPLPAPDQSPRSDQS